MRYYNPKLKATARTLRANLTDSEQRLWSRLRRKQMHGVQFYRQRPIGEHIVDFFAPAANLIIEVDGSQHYDATLAESDERRTRLLEAQDLRLLRFTNLEVLQQIDSVVEEIYRVVEERLGKSPSVPLLQRGKRS